MAFTKLTSFSKKPSDLPDVPSPSMTPDDIRSMWETPLDELLENAQETVDTLNNTSSGTSGADNIGATGWTGAANTIQALLNWLKANKTDLTGDHKGTWQGFKPTQTDPGIQGQVDSNTSQLADIVINIKSYGAKSDGTDAAPAIRDAISYLTSIGGGTLLIPEGTFLLKTYDPAIELGGYYIFKLTDNITVKGKGKLSVLKVGDNISSAINDGSSGVNIFLSNNRTNVHLRTFRVDYNGQNNLVPQGVIRTFYGANFQGGSDCSVERTYWDNCPGRNVILFGGYSLQNPTRTIGRIFKNTITNYGSGVFGNTYQNDSSAIYCSWEGVEIEKNRITNDNPPTNGRGGIELHNNNLRAKNNYMKYCYPAVYVCSDFTSWKANNHYNVGDIVIPTRGKFVGKQYICTVSGTSGSTEPTWGTATTDNTVSWSDNGLAQMTNQVVEDNTFDKCHGGVFLWNGGGDFTSTKITNNKIGLMQSPSIQNAITGINQVQGNDASGLTIPVNNNLLIKNNEIFEDDVINTSSSQRVSGITVYSGDNIRILENNIHDMDGTPITLLGSPRYLKNVEVKRNTIKNFQINNVTSAKGAIVFNLTGSTSIPTVTAFNATDIAITHNTITNDVMDSTAYPFYFDWGSASIITNLVVADNTLNNLVGVKAGAKLSLVTVTPVTYFSSATGYVTDKNGLTIQWTRVTYTATAGTNQNFSFPIPFQTVNCHVQLTPSNNSNVIAALVSKTATQFTIMCNTTSVDIYVYAVGN